MPNYIIVEGPINRFTKYIAEDFMNYIYEPHRALSHLSYLLRRFGMQKRLIRYNMETGECEDVDSVSTVPAFRISLGTVDDIMRQSTFTR